MADLHDDRKKEEEEYGGFEPDENDDESFMLEDDNEYPAKLPENFSDEPSPKQKVTFSAEADDSDSIEDEPNTEESISSEDESEIEYIGDDEQIVKDEIEEIDDIEEDEQEIEDTIEDKIEEPILGEEEDTTVELDEDFKKRIQEDLDKSKAKRETKDELEEKPQQIAKQIGDDADTVVMLSDIDADKPSNYKEVDETVDQLPIEGHIAENIEGDKAEETIEAEIDEKESKRKTPVWIMMLYSAVATFLVTLAAVWLIWSLMSDSGDNLPPKEPGQTELAEMPIQEHHEAQQPIKDSISSEEKNWLDSMDMDKGDTILRSKEDKEFFSDLIDGEDYDEIPEKPTKPKKESAKKKESKQNKPKKSGSEDIASKDVTNNLESKPKQRSKRIDESKFSMPQPKGPVPEIGTFTVQIYSSPSREDAESWLGQLKAKQVPNAMITEQEIKGRTWYRVRYGAYETKEQARASALELGYSQSWIDRIK